MKKKSDWPALLEAFEGCGLTHAQFCGKHNISMASFQQRLYRSRKELREAGGFSQIAIGSPASEAPWAEVDLPGGIRLRLPRPVDAAYLGELLARLRP